MNKEDFDFYMGWADSQLRKASEFIANAKRKPNKYDIRDACHLQRTAAANLKGAKKALHER